MKMKKSIALVVSLILVLTVTVGGTLAFLIATSDPVKNTFTPSKVTTEVEETFENNVKTNVSIKNTGDTDAWIRAAVVISWQDANGNVYGQAPVEGVDYNITYGDKNWRVGSDGFWYYTKPVAAGSTTENLIDLCIPSQSAPAEGYSLCVEIIGSGIQNKPASVFDTEWASSGLTVDDSAEDPKNWTLQ